MQGMAQDESYQERYMPEHMRRGAGLEAPTAAYGGVRYGGATQGEGGGGLYGGRQGEGGSGRRSKLDDLKGELHSIRDRFRDVKIEEMRILEQRQKLGEGAQGPGAEEAGHAGQPGPRGASGTGAGSAGQIDQRAAYFAKFDPKKAAAMQRAAQAHSMAEGGSTARKEEAKAYFERTRGIHDAAWLHRAEAEAYFEEKRRMADAAWRMQKLMDAKPQQWQIEMEQEKQRLAKGGGRNKGQAKGQGKAAARNKAAAPAPKEKKPQGPAGYLFPWGTPKPTKAPPPPASNGIIRHDVDDVTAPPPDFDKLEYPPEESLTLGQLEGLTLPSKESSLLPVSFNPSVLPEDMPRSFDYSTVGFGTTPSFEPLSPRGYRAPLDLGGIDLGLEGLGLKPAKQPPLPTSYPPRRVTPQGPGYSGRVPPQGPGYSGSAYDGPQNSDEAGGLEASRGEDEEGPATSLQFPSSTLLALASEEEPSKELPSLEPYALRPLKIDRSAGESPAQRGPKMDYWSAMDDSPPSVIQARFSGSLSGDQDCDGDFDSRGFSVLPEIKAAGEEGAEGDGGFHPTSFGALPVIQAALEEEEEEEEVEGGGGFHASFLAELRRAQGTWGQGGAGAGEVAEKGGKNGGPQSQREPPVVKRSAPRVEDLSMPSPPMALRVLSKQKGVQELML